MAAVDALLDAFARLTADEQRAWLAQAAARARFEGGAAVYEAGERALDRVVDLLALPYELRTRILAHLQIRDLVRLSATNKAYRDLVRTHPVFLGWFNALAPLAARQKGVTWRDVRDAYVEADALLCGRATTASVPWLLHKDVGPAIRLRGTLLVREELVQGQGLAVIVSDVRGWCAPPLPSADLASPLIGETVVPVDREVQFVDVNASVDLLVTAHPFRTTLAIWRLSTRALLRTITPCHTTAFLGMSLSRGRGDPRIATAGADGSVVLWSATTGEQLAVWSDSANVCGRAAQFIANVIDAIHVREDSVLLCMSSRLVLEMLELVIGSDDVLKQAWFRAPGQVQDVLVAPLLPGEAWPIHRMGGPLVTLMRDRAVVVCETSSSAAVAAPHPSERVYVKLYESVRALDPTGRKQGAMLPHLLHGLCPAREPPRATGATFHSRSIVLASQASTVVAQPLLGSATQSIFSWRMRVNVSALALSRDISEA